MRLSRCFRTSFMWMPTQVPAGVLGEDPSGRRLEKLTFCVGRILYRYYILCSIRLHFSEGFFL